jgi:hypothetical protein
MSRKIGRITTLVLVALFGAARPVGAQGTWPGHGAPRSISVEILRPSVRRGGFRTNQGLISGVVVATGRFALGPSGHVVVELPVAHGSFRAAGSGIGAAPEASGTTIGSPYVGLQVGAPGGGTFLQFGFRLPLVAVPASASDSSSLAVGRFADAERADAFTPRIGTISALVGYGFAGAHGLRVRVSGGPLGQFTTARVTGGALALWFAYRVEAGYEGRSLILLGGVAGRMTMTPGGASVGWRTPQQLVLTLRIKTAGVEPSATVRVPFGAALRRAAGPAFGFGVAVPLT